MGRGDGGKWGSAVLDDNRKMSVTGEESVLDIGQGYESSQLQSSAYAIVQGIRGIDDDQSRIL